MDIFTEIGVILAFALIISTIMRFAKQPLLIGYIITGIIVGPAYLGILHSTEVIELFSKLGITSLLFIVGLKLSPKVIKELGLVSAVTGVGQVLFTSLFGFLISRGLGYDLVPALYIAVALTFSSTIIILKLLSDKGDINKLYGKISIGFLLVQDLIATIILVVISSSTGLSPDSNIYLELALILGQGFLLLVSLFAISLFILPKAINFIGASQEFLFIAALSWGILIAVLYQKLGLSIEIGALVAGVSLSMTPFALEISSRLKPLRDFFIILFFILLGSQLVLENWAELLAPTVVLSSFVLIGNPLIVLILLNLLGYTKRTGFFAGLTVAQISEFSLILVTLGYSVGHLSREVLSLVTLVGIITIAGSTYLILYSDHIFAKLRNFLALFEFRKKNKQIEDDGTDIDAIIFGYHRAGPEFAHTFSKLGYKYLVVDIDPNTVQELEKRGVLSDYGDASDIDFLEELPLSDVKILVSSVPDNEANQILLKTFRQVNPEAIAVIINDKMSTSEELYKAGATHVVMSHYIGAHQAAELILESGFDKEKYGEARRKYMEYHESVREFSLSAD